MSAPFARRDVVELFLDLAERLRRRGVHGSVYILGGAAMALLYDERRVTRDIDSVVLEGHGPLTDAVREIAHERGLPGTWLNEQAAAYVSREHDHERATVFDHPNLIVAAASPRHLLAMKLGAARPSDVGDIRLLLDLLGIESLEACEKVLRELFPGDELKPRARLIVEDLLTNR